MKELEKDELMKVEGGMVWLPIALAFLGYLASDWDNFERGLMGRPCKDK